MTAGLDRNFSVSTIESWSDSSKAEGKSREKLMQVRLQPAEYETFKVAAVKAGLDLSGWLRERLLDAARKEKRYQRALEK